MFKVQTTKSELARVLANAAKSTLDLSFINSLYSDRLVVVEEVQLCESRQGSS